VKVVCWERTQDNFVADIRQFCPLPSRIQWEGSKKLWKRKLCSDLWKKRQRALATQDIAVASLVISELTGRCLGAKGWMGEYWYQRCRNMCHQYADRYSLLGRLWRWMSTVVKKYPIYVEGERQRHDQTYISWIYTTTTEKKKLLYEHRLCGVWSTTDSLPTVTQDSQSVYLLQALQEIDFWDPASFHHAWLGLFATISYETSFQSCRKMLICRL